MLKLLVADDEKYDRDSIIAMLNAEFKDVLEICEAKNGREAIEVSERIRPDIVIMDIKMPGINGLKAIQEIKKFLPNIYCIIVTAYDYFDFAVEAVKINVKEYILKPFSKADIIEKIREAINTVNVEKEKRRSEIENQEKLYNLIPVLENELSYSIINNNLRAIDYETYLRYLNMDFKYACAMVVRIKEKPAYLNTAETLTEDVKFQAGEYIKEYITRRCKAIASYRFTKELVYFVQVKEYEDMEETKFSIVNMAVDIRREIKRAYGLSVRIGVGRCYSGLKQMHKSYEEARASLEYKSENLNVIYFGDINPDFQEKESFNEKITNVDKQKIALFQVVEQYITDNLKEDLKLEDTAAKFNLSSYYFSRTFKEVVGCNFSDYINMVRINKAKEMLQHDSISIKEVCYSVGYSDPNYFSKVFKKYEGVSPTEFKGK
ncbi:response regulator [Clostridium thermarum]|uniref:response regulator n=1 Tax=Clostridium thermarum TaxID=1716543 RepID=UPI0011204A08|nr:response regulator [Clostridium thermarum]